LFEYFDFFKKEKKMIRTKKDCEKYIDDVYIPYPNGWLEHLSFYNGEYYCFGRCRYNLQPPKQKIISKEEAISIAWKGRKYINKNLRWASM
jgi:hypothetical protein